MDNPVRSPFTKSKDRNRWEDSSKSINRNEPKRIEQNRILYGGGREELHSDLGENCFAE